MAHKRKGQLTVSGEWARHLRPLLRRAFWKGERQAAKVEEREGPKAMNFERVGMPLGPTLLSAGRHSSATAPMATLPAGYSGTPLAGKLGIKPSCRLCVLGDAPLDYAQLLAPLPPGVLFESQPGAATDIAQLFATDAVELKAQLAFLRRVLKPSAALWVSWPKKASKVQTTITEGTVRDLALPLGWVDIKVCAVTAVWSGLKLVVRKEPR